MTGRVQHWALAVAAVLLLGTGTHIAFFQKGNYAMHDFLDPFARAPRQSAESGVWGSRQKIRIIGGDIAAFPPIPPVPYAVGAVVDSAVLVDSHGSDRCHTVTLIGAQPDLPSAPGNPEFEVVAELQWGSHGVMSQAHVDILDGAEIGLCAENVRVIGFIRTIGAGMMPSTQELMLGAFVTPGARGTSTAQRTVHGEPIAVGVTTGQYPLGAVPSLVGQGPPRVAFARKFRVYCSPQNAALRMDLLGSGAVPIGSIDMVAFPTDWFEVPSGAIGYWFTNIGAVAVTRFRVEFELAL